MRKKMLLSLIVLCVCCTTTALAQKIGRINYEDVILSLPESDSAQVKIQALITELNEQAQTMRVEFNNKLADYQKKQATYTPAVSEVKQKELADYSENMQKMEQVAQQDLSDLQAKLYQPIVTKVKEAVAKAAKAQGLTMVIDPLQDPSLIYIDEAATPDMTDSVIKALGGTRKPAAANAAATN